MFSVEWSEEALKQLKKLDKTIAKRIVDKTDNIRDVPHHFLERMVGTDMWKLRIGDYRILIQIIEKGKKLFVVTVGHRKNVYKNV